MLRRVGLPTLALSINRRLGTRRAENAAKSQSDSDGRRYLDRVSLRPLCAGSWLVRVALPAFTLCLAVAAAKCLRPRRIGLRAAGGRLYASGVARPAPRTAIDCSGRCVRHR